MCSPIPVLPSARRDRRRETLKLGLACALGLAISGLAQAPPDQAAPATRSFPPGTRQIAIPPVAHVNRALLGYIAPLVERAIARGAFPGAVILAAHRGQIIYQGVFGSRRILPNVAPMRYNTIFDLASLTKVIATTPAVMQLLEEGRLRLDAPVARYWPAFARHGKGALTIRELMTHFSGLPPDIPSPVLLELLHLPPTHFPGWPKHQKVNQPWHGLAAAKRLIEQARLIHPPGKKFVYSDINFIVMGYLVQRLTGEPLNVYDQKHLFGPLGMRDTMFQPPAALRDRIAPTQVINGSLRWGTVHDPTAAAMGGVSGMAGLFSDAHDLGLYAQMLLNGGVLNVRRQRGGQADYRRTRILGPLTVLKMTTPQSPAGNPDLRGLGWDVDSSFTNRGELFPYGSYGHTGWTGTSIWIDPYTQSYLIILTSRCHPQPLPGSDPLIRLRLRIANIVAASLDEVNLRGLSNTGPGELWRAYPHPKAKKK